MAAIDIMDLLDKLRAAITGTPSATSDTSSAPTQDSGDISPGGMSVTTPDGRGMSVPVPVGGMSAPDDASLPPPVGMSGKQNFSSSGVPQPVASASSSALPAPVGSASPSDSGQDLGQHVMPSLGGIFGNWSTLSDNDKGNVLMKIGLGLMNAQPGKTAIQNLGAAGQAYNTEREQQQQNILKQQNTKREQDLKNQENLAQMGYKNALIDTKETPEQKRQATLIDNLRKVYTTKDMMGNEQVDTTGFNKALAANGVNLAIPGNTPPAPPPAAPSLMSRIFGGSDSSAPAVLPAPVGMQNPAPATGGPIVPPASVLAPTAAPAAPTPSVSAPNVPPAAIAFLKQNPATAPIFEKKYGVSAKQYLGK